MSYQSIIPAIQSTLESVTAIRDVYAYPLDGNPKEYPSAIFFPDSFDNQYETNTENKKNYTFKVFLVVDLSGTDEQTVFTSILPNVVDDVLAAFDAAWNGGVINGHRVWYTLTNGLWSLSEEQKGKRAYAEMDLRVELLTNN